MKFWIALCLSLIWKDMKLWFTLICLSLILNIKLWLALCFFFHINIYECKYVAINRLCHVYLWYEWIWMCPNEKFRSDICKCKYIDHRLLSLWLKVSLVCFPVKVLKTFIKISKMWLKILKLLLELSILRKIDSQV